MSSLRLNILSSLISKIFTYLINSYLIVEVISSSSPDKFGQWLALIGYLSLISFMELGASSSLVNTVSKSKNKRSVLVNYIDTGLLLTFLCVLMFFPLIILINNFLLLDEKFSQLSVQDFYFILFISCLSLPISFLNHSFLSLEKAWIYNLINICVYFITLLIITSLNSTRFDLYIYSGVPIFIQCAMLVLLRLKLVRAGRTSLSTFVNILKSGRDFITINLSNHLATSADKIILFPILGGEAIALVVVLERLYLPINFLQVVFKNFWPVYAVSESSQTSVNLYRLSLKASFIIGSIYYVAVFVFLNFIIKNIIPDTLEVTYLLVFVFFISRIPNMLTEPLIPLLTTDKYKKLYARFVGLNALLGTTIKVVITLKYPSLEVYLISTSIIFTSLFVIPICWVLFRK